MDSDKAKDDLDAIDEADENVRFFTGQKSKKSRESGKELEAGDNMDNLSLSNIGSEELREGTCLTLRVLQTVFTCGKKKDLWEPSQGNVFKSHEVEETKYPKILKILEFGNLLDILFVTTCWISIYVFFLSLGFVMKSKVLWGIIHINNSLYTLCLFAQWFRVLMTTKYAKTNQGYTKTDVVMALITVFPIDLILLVIYSLNQKEVDTPVDSLIISLSRLNYLFRVYYISKYFSTWENQLVVGDFVMFIIRTTLYSLFLIHIFGCIWHRVACRSLTLKHFLMTQDEATRDVCEENSWIIVLLRDNRTPLLDHPELNVLLTHYFVSIYWATTVALGLGLGDIKVQLSSDLEIVVTAATQITAWIFTLAVVSGTLTSLLVEGDTERQSYLTRRFAIKHYLDFTGVGRRIMTEVANFYDYLWQRRKGIMQLELIDEMPKTMRAEVFYDVNKFVFDQLPLFRDMDQAFMMNLAVHVEHTFHLNGEILFRKNDAGDRMRYVLKGYLEILCDDESRVIANIRSGSAIGEIHLIHPYPHVSTVRCGSECDILVLRKAGFKQLMNSYPEHWGIFRERMQKRFDDSELLLSLCDKHNTYPLAFSKVDQRLRPYGHDVVTGRRISPNLEGEQGPVEKITNLVPVGGEGGAKNFKNSDDVDGVSLDEGAIKKIAMIRATTERERAEKLEKHDRVLEEEALKALETDVMRAGSLAKDLEIPRPPLFVTAPTFTTKSTQNDTRMGFWSRVNPTTLLLSVRVVAALATLGAVWFYLYAMAFRSRTTIIVSLVFHLTDIIFAGHFWLEKTQIVVTPQKTLENLREILLYHLKTPATYFEFFAFVPWEYLMTPLFRGTMLNFDNPQAELMFSCFKLNRCLQLLVILKILQEFEAVQVMSVMKMFIAKFFVAILLTIHVFAVAFRLTKELVEGWVQANEYEYEIPFYWSAVITTATGFGDYMYRAHGEVVILTFGCVTGTIVSVYYGAKNAALLANYARRRVAFKQMFYCAKTFMKQRKFSKPLVVRVLDYYQLQWRAHEGTLTPTARSVIWDAPESILREVTMEQAKTFLARVPLVQHCGAATQHHYARSLKQYHVPPAETLLYPYDKRRELFFLVKGYCAIIKDGVRVGTFTAGNYFGLPGLLYGVNKEYEIVTETYCLFFCLLFEEYVKLARSNHCVLRDYKVFRGETTFRKNMVIPSQPRVIPLELPRYYETLFKDNPTGLKPVASQVEPEQRSRNNENIGFCWRYFPFVKYVMLLPTILPTGKFIRIWTSLRTLSALLTTVFVTAQACFPFHPGWCFVVMFIFDVVTWTDMYLLGHLGYYGPEGQLITDRLMTMRHYLEGSYLLDWIAAFPIDYFFLPRASRGLNLFGSLIPRTYTGNYWVQVVALLRLPRCLQIWRLFKTESVIKMFIFKSLTFITLVDVVPIMFLFLHLITCLAAVLNCRWSTEVNPACPETNLFINFKPLNNYNFSVPGTQLSTPQNYDIFDPFTMYVTGLYWSIQTALSVGFGDFNVYDERHYFPTSNRILSVSVIILGTGVSVYLGAKLTACMVGEDSRRIEIREQMKVVFDFLGQYNVRKPIQRRVREVYFSSWDKTKGIAPSDLFNSLHPTLKADVTKQLYEVHLRKSPLLKHIDDGGIRMLASKLREVFYPEGEYVMKLGDLNDDIFMISTGVIVCYGIGGQVLSYLTVGSIFGEISALFEVQRLYSAIAAVDADMFVFKREDFMEFLNMYPTIRQTFENSCLIHYKEIMEGAAQASGIEVILPALDFQDFDDKVEPPPLLTSAAEKDDEAEKERRMSAPFIGDALRVTLSSKAKAAGETGTKEEKIDVEENSDRNSKWWSFLLTFGRIPRDEMGLIHVHQERNKCNILDFVINPQCPLCSKAMFDCIWLLLTCISCSLASYDLAFRVDTDPESSSGTQMAVLMGIKICVEIFFLVRFIGNFHLAVFDDEGILIIKNREIIRRYATRFDGLALDVITFPFWIIVVYTYPPAAPFFKGIQMLRVVLFWRYVNETESELRMQASMIKIVKISIILCFIFHFCACFWYMIACSGMVCEPDSWMERALERMKLDENLGVNDPPPSVSLGSRYFMSAFYVTTAITFTGLNYIEPARLAEIIVTVLFIFATVFVIGILVGEITQALASQVSGKIHYEHQLSVIQSHFMTLGLRRTKLKEVTSYYKVLWHKCKGIPYSKMFADIPYPLRADIAYAIYAGNIKNSRILGKVDDTIIRQLCARVRHEAYLPGCRIVRSGDVCDAMYFIKRGEVVILDENQNLELCVEILYENECFGEVKLLLPKEQYRFSYVARLESEVGILHREDLEEVLNNYPLLQGDLTDKAKKIKNHRTVLREEESRQKRIELGIDDMPEEPDHDDGMVDVEQAPIAKEFHRGGGSKVLVQKQRPRNSSPGTEPT